jgi:hypothetical protein
MVSAARLPLALEEATIVDILRGVYRLALGDNVRNVRPNSGYFLA